MRPSGMLGKINLDISQLGSMSCRWVPVVWLTVVNA